MTNGRRGICPAATARSPAAICAESAAEMDGAGVREIRVMPRNRPVERPIHLADARAVAEPLQAQGVPGRRAVARDRHQLPRGDVEEDGAHRRQVGEAPHRGAGDHLPAEATDLPDEGIRQPLGAAQDDRPADRVCGDGQDQPERGAPQGLQGNDRMGRKRAEERPRRLLAERQAGQSPGWEQSRRPEPGGGDDMAGGPRDGTQDPGHESLGVQRQRADQASPGGPVTAQPGCRLVDRSMKQDRAVRGEDMGRGHVRVRQRHAERSEVQRAEER